MARYPQRCWSWFTGLELGRPRELAGAAPTSRKTGHACRLVGQVGLKEER